MTDLICTDMEQQKPAIRVGRKQASHTKTTKYDQDRELPSNARPESITFPSYRNLQTRHKLSPLHSNSLKNAIRSAWASRREAKELMPCLQGTAWAGSSL